MSHHVKSFNLVERLKVRDSPVSECRRMYTKSLTVDTMNKRMIKLEYAVRGPVAARCIEIEAELKRGVSKPFESVTKAHVGEPQAMGQPPLTFFRQVLSSVLHPSLMTSAGFPSDVTDRAKEMLSHCVGRSLGSYTSPLGIEAVRRRCAAYIERRDGGARAGGCDVWLTAGASAAIRAVLKMFINRIDGKPSSIMIPIPQYPLYSATLTEYGIEQAGYFLDEADNWALNVRELERSYAQAQETSAVRAIVVINPGNPTGQVLTRTNIEEIIKFAHKHTLFILADEVYQENVYAEESQFYSFKKVLTEMETPYSDVELASFMSCSKGYVGECGLRGGYVEFANVESNVLECLYKTVACGCPTVTGQLCMDLVAGPPQPGDPSYELFTEERSNILESLRRRAELVADTFNGMEGFSCNQVQGAMYAFPKITLPDKAIETAKAQGVAPDVYYAFKLLEETGICVVPGSGFGQATGTHHFRTTILPPPARLRSVMDTFRAFHARFTREHS